MALLDLQGLEIQHPEQAGPRASYLSMSCLSDLSVMLCGCPFSAVSILLCD